MILQFAGTNVIRNQRVAAAFPKEMEAENLAIDRRTGDGESVQPIIQPPSTTTYSSVNPPTSGYSPAGCQQSTAVAAVPTDSIHLDLSDILKLLDDELQQLELNCRDRAKLERFIHFRRLQGPDSQLLQDADSSPMTVTENLSIQMRTLGDLIVQRQDNIRLYALDIESKASLTFDYLSTTFVGIQDDIEAWKINQRLQAAYTNNDERKLRNEDQFNQLDELQIHCESLANLLLKFRSNLNTLEGIRRRLANYVSLYYLFTIDYRAQVIRLLHQLMSISFIIETQPSQVLLLRSRLHPIVVRFLLGHTFNMYCIGQEVKANLTDEDDMQALKAIQKTQHSINIINSNKFELLNKTNTFKYSEDTKHCRATFNNLQVERLEKNKSDCEKPFWFCFITILKVVDLVFELETISSPFVVITNKTQYPTAIASIFWNNIITTTSTSTCSTEQESITAGWSSSTEKVSWSAIASELYKFFINVTGCRLNEDHLSYLKSILIHGHTNDEQVTNDEHHLVVTKSNLCKEILAGRNYTFWDWFHSFIQLFQLDTNLNDLWIENLVMGFVSREKTEKLLKHSTDGTIILRFSESYLGGLTVSCISHDRFVFSVSPWTLDDLKNRCLINRLLDIDAFRYIYPNLPLQETIAVFAKPVDMTLGQINKQSKGYVKPLLRVFLPGVTDSLRRYDSAPSPFPIQPEHVDSEVAFDEIVEDISNNWSNESSTATSVLVPNFNYVHGRTHRTLMNMSPHPEVKEELEEPTYINLDSQGAASRFTRPIPEENQPIRSTNTNGMPVRNLNAFQPPKASSLPTRVGTTIVEKSSSEHSTTQELRARRRRVSAGFIMKKRDRDKSKSKRKKSLAKWAKDLTDTCGCRVLLMVENAILCDSLEGGKDAIELPDSVKHEFDRKEPSVIPDEVLRRLFQNMTITKHRGSSTSGHSGVKRFKPSDESSPLFRLFGSNNMSNTMPKMPENPNTSNDLRCQICYSNIDPLSKQVSNVVTVWLKCKSLLTQCNYYVHANCIGIGLRHQIEAQSIPFYCPSHLREEFLRKTFNTYATN